MRILKQEIYFPIIIAIHFIFWAIDLSMYDGDFMEVSSDTLFFGEMTNESWKNIHRILGEVLSSWVVTVFAANFLMATRAKWVENLFGGLDKMYLIHRRSGMIAVVLLIAHFIVVPRDLTEFNIGKPLGFYALILILIGVIVSAAPPLKKKVPYNKWINFHKLMGVFYVMAVAHGMIVHSLIKELPITRVYVFGMAAVGIFAWIYRAFLYGLFNKQLDYTVSGVQNLGNGVTEVKLTAVANNLNFKAGQFAFFKFPDLSKKEQHPFTISSHPYQDGLRLSIKGLGDYTDNFSTKIKTGDLAKVEGPFGHFSSKYVKELEQVWIAGGIGITPFLSLAGDVYTNKVKLFYCVKNKEEAIYTDELTAVSRDNPNFEFIIWNSDEKGHLSVDQLGFSDLKSKAFLICGPKALKNSMFKQLEEHKVKRDLIYDEEFTFR